MKPKSFASSTAALAAIVITITITPALRAADLYWDVNNDTTGSGNAVGTWDTSTTANWSTLADGTAIAETFQDGDAAIFSAGADGTGSWTVNVSGSVQPASITFKENGTKTLSGGEISVALSPVISSAGRGNGFNYNISSKLTGTGSITLAANGATSDSGDGVGGNLTLNNNTNDFTGDVTITSGVVNFSSDAAFGNSSNDIIIQGGGLVCTAATNSLPSTRDIIFSGGGDKIFRLYGSSTFTVDSTITGSGNLRHTDGGNLILNGPNTFTGNIENHRGNLTLGNSAHVGNVSMFQGTLALKTGNTYTGITHMRGSNTLRLDEDNALPDGSYCVFWGGTTFNVNGRTDTTGALTTGSSGDTNVVMNLGDGGNLTVSTTSSQAPSVATATPLGTAESPEPATSPTPTPPPPAEPSNGTSATPTTTSPGTGPSATAASASNPIHSQTPHSETSKTTSSSMAMSSNPSTNKAASPASRSPTANPSPTPPPAPSPSTPAKKEPSTSGAAPPRPSTASSPAAETSARKTLEPSF